jgi:hypothetical protein
MFDEEETNGPFVLNVVLENMVEAFKCDNPRFSESRFKEACKKDSKFSIHYYASAVCGGRRVPLI